MNSAENWDDDRKVKFKPRRSTKYIVVHCSATPARMDIGVEDIRRWHMQKGWIDVGYHYIIRRDGSLELGRPTGVMGAHVRGHNHEAVGICLIGGVDDENQPSNNFTPPQWVTLHAVVEWLSRAYEDAEVVGHTDLDPKKACPSFNAKEWWNGIQ